MENASAPSYSLGSLGIETRKLGMWVFLASEVMFFTGLIGAYIVLRMAQPSWPVPSTVLNIPLTAVNTFILICSSATLVKGLESARKGDTEGMQVGLFLTVLLGTLFLSVQMYEYNELIHVRKFTPSGSLFGTVFFTLTGFHGCHVFIGVLCMLFVFIRSLQGRYTATDNRGIEIAGLYWHFVDLVWIILFTILYLI
ncbi:MAG TPA: heme-copper oxidase subunit III [bacterium]|nr:heme-copper oxidase subunit III [bacterium]